MTKDNLQARIISKITSPQLAVDKGRSIEKGDTIDELREKIINNPIY